jgi:DNA repair protein RadC
MNSDFSKDHEGHRERLRKRFITFADQVSEIELLELILTYSIPRKDVAPLARNLLQHFSSIDAIISAPFEELSSFPGIGESTATLFRIIDAIKMKKSFVQQPTLFNSHEVIGQELDPEPRAMRVFANDEIANSLLLLPKAPSFTNLEEYKNYLICNLPYNSEETRRRRANYIIDRFYSTGKFKSPLTLFLSHEPQDKVLKPIVFYHILKSEPIAIKVAEELVYPLLPIGRTNRDQVKDFVLKYLPEASDSSLKNMLRAIFYSYNLLGIGNVVGETLRFQLRPGEFEPLLYVFTSEFSKPGIYTFDQLYQGPLHRWLLWDREWLRRQLYNLRDLGIISKISEIDNVKQFTVSLDQTAALKEYFSKSKDKAFFLREKPEDISDTKHEYAEPYGGSEL